MHPEIFVTVGDHDAHAITDVSQYIAAGGRHALARVASTEVYAFGQITSRDGEIQALPSPSRVAGLAQITAVGAGRDQNLAIGASALASAWGDNEDGQLGSDPQLEAKRLSPAPISDLTHVIKVAGGAEHSLALTSEQTVLAWGNNDTGQLGTALPAGGDRHSPAKIGLDGIRDIAAGPYHNLAIDGGGAVWAWGKGRFGQLGDGQAVSDFNPGPRRVELPEGVHAVAVAASTYFSLAVDDSGAVWGWGRDPKVLGAPGPVAVPHKLPGLEDIKAVAAGQRHALALSASGKVWVWGYNAAGLGDGSTTSSSTPVEVAGLGEVLAIASGAQFMVAVTADGKLWAWGRGSYGQLGQGSEASSPVPVEVPGLSIAGPEHEHERLGEQDFERVVVDEAGEIKTFTIENYGTAPLTLASLSIIGDDAADFQLTQPAQLVLGPGEQTQLEVRFAPKSAGDKQATLKIVSDDVGDEDYEVPLAAVAEEPAPRLVFKLEGSDEPLGPDFDFGAIEGKETTQTFVIENAGGGELVLDGDPLIRLESDSFTLVSGPDKSKLKAGETTTFTVRFAPKANAETEAGLLVETNAGSASLTVEGSLDGPSLELSAGGEAITGASGELDLGEHFVGSAGKQVTLTIHNGGNQPLSLPTDLALAGPDAGDFLLTGTLPASLAVGESTKLVVQFKPGSEAGAKQASLTITSDDPLRPSVELGLRAVASSAVATSKANRFDSWMGGSALVIDDQGRLRYWLNMVYMGTGARFKDTGINSGARGIVITGDKGTTSWLLHEDGKVYPVAGGLYTSSLAAAIPGLEDIVQIGGIMRPVKNGAPNHCADWTYRRYQLYCLGRDGSFWVWDGSRVGKASNKPVRAFATGMDHMVVAHTDGTVTNDSGTANSSGLTDVVDVAANVRHYYNKYAPGPFHRTTQSWVESVGCNGAVLKSDGSVWLWPDAKTLTPQQAQLPEGREIVRLVSGGLQTCGVDEQGDSWVLYHDRPPTRHPIRKLAVLQDAYFLTSQNRWALDTDGKLYFAGVYVKPGTIEKIELESYTRIPL